MAKDKKLSLNSKIIITLLTGLIVGLIVGDTRVSDFMKEMIVFGVFNVIGQVFINMLSMLVLPVILFSLISGIAGLGDMKRITKLGGQTIVFFVLSSVVALLLAISAAYIFEPGRGMLISDSILNTEDVPGFAKVIIDIVPKNPFLAMKNGNMLQVIIFTALIGISISALGKKVQNTITLIKQINKLVVKMINMIMAVAPIGVFALVINVFAKEGFDAFIPMLNYMGTVTLVLLIHSVLVYGGVLKLMKLKISIFLLKFRSVFLTGFSSSSSNATLPITMSTVQYKLGVSHKITSSVLPLGVTINKNGTMIMQGVATIFISQAYGMELSLATILTIIVFIFVATLGTAGIPSAGMLTISVVLAQAGLPVEGIALIIGVDRLLDMLRTTVNLAGNSVASMLIAKGDGKFNELIYNDPDAALGEEKTIGEFGQEISINKCYINQLQEDKVGDLSEE